MNWGALLSLAMLMSAGILHGYRSGSSGGNAVQPSPPPPSPKQVIALGDSITAGTGISGVSDYYPDLLATNLGAGWSVTNGGRSGSLVAGLTGTYTNTYRNHGFSYAICMAGVNDIMKTQEGRTSAQAIADFTNLIQTLQADGLTVKVLLATPANNASGDFAPTSDKNTQWLAYHSALASLCTSYGVSYADTWPTMGNNDSPPTMLNTMQSPDNIHPGQAGMNELARLAATIFP